MRASLVAAFALGFSVGALCLCAVLGLSGALGTTRSQAAVLAQPKPPYAPPDLSRAERITKAIVPPPVDTREGSAPKQGSADRMEPLLIPVPGVDANQLADTFHEKRGSHAHEALDIPAARGTPVRAAAEGNVAKLFTSKEGGLTVYEFDDSRTFCYYYAHLDHYAAGLREGVLLRRGDVLGYVGTTGNALSNAPHLHFAIFRLGPEKKWWQGTAIDPLPLLR